MNIEKKSEDSKRFDLILNALIWILGGGMFIYLGILWFSKNTDNLGNVIFLLGFAILFFPGLILAFIGFKFLINGLSPPKQNG